MHGVYGACHARGVMDAGTDAETERPVTAGGPWARLVLGIIVLLLIATGVLTATGGSSTPGASAGVGRACSPAAEEPLDPSSVVRLLPNTAKPKYASNPPTSGASELGTQVPAVSTVELSPPVQVGLLAQGTVLIQYRGLAPADLASLTSLAGDGVVVAPNSSLTSSVVATAWRKRQVCTSLDVDALRQFAVLSADRGPAAGPNGTSPTTTP
jgi:hypothetical protein